MTSTKPISGPAMDKSTFATKWCNTFRDLINGMHLDGCAELKDRITNIKENNTAMKAEGQSLGFKEEDWPKDVNLPLPKYLPGEEGFGFTNPYTAGWMAINIGKEMKAAMDIGLFG